jgi:ferredoxin
MEMPKLTIEGHGSVEVAGGTRLVNAIEAAGVDILHRCGGNARCTTCRVNFTSGEPTSMTEAELSKLTERELLGQARLSCQIECNDDMTVRPLMRLRDNPTMSDVGSPPAAEITPEPVWTTRP